MDEPRPPIRTIADGQVTSVILDRPEALNAITPAMLNALVRALDEIAADGSVSVVVLTGEGRAFSAGVDLKSLGGMALVDGAVGDVLDVPARAVIERLRTIPKVVIAKVNGHCYTGALELAMACDLIVVAEEAKLGDTHAKWGLRPSWGMSQQLALLVGIARARELSYTARTFNGVEAAEWGLAVRAVPSQELDAAVGEMAHTIAQMSAGSIAAYKDLYRHALEVGLSDGLAYEAATSYPIGDTEDRIAAFR